MTRLNRQHIEETQQQLEDIDRTLRTCAGVNLREAALKTIGCDGSEDSISKPVTVSTVPITSGQGIITGFSDTVAAIAAHVGFYARTTRATDGAGIAEAYESACDILVTADDHRFVAINTHRRSVVDNNTTTGQSFAMLLSLMAGGVDGKTCGVIGCGPVGTAAASRLISMGAAVILCDIDPSRTRRLTGTLYENDGQTCRSTDDAAALLQETDLIVDASPAGRIIEASMVNPKTMIVCPGVPHGLTSDAMVRLGKRFYHDQLPLGVATMVLAAAENRLGITPPFRAENDLTVPVH